MKRLIIALLLIVTSGTDAALGRGPNVVIFYADDMGIGDLGCYGCRDIKTPNIDALARSGVRFTNYYSAAPLCAPSRAALLTGEHDPRLPYQKKLGVWLDEQAVPNRFVVFPEKGHEFPEDFSHHLDVSLAYLLQREEQ